MKINPSLLGWDRVSPPQIRPTTIRSIPTGSARVIVTIDGKPYAGFLSREYAVDAIRLWNAEVNGSGFPVPLEKRDGCGWQAVRGRVLSVIER